MPWNCTCKLAARIIIVTCSRVAHISLNRWRINPVWKRKLLLCGQMTCKRHLTKCNALTAYSDHNYQFGMYTDASDFQLGACVSTKTGKLPLLKMALPFPVMSPTISGTVSNSTASIPAIYQYWNKCDSIFPISYTGLCICPISSTGLCQFWYGHLLGPVPELDSMRLIPFLVLGSASSGTGIHWVPYRNWTLCAWSHFRYWDLPVLVRASIGPCTGTGLCAVGLISGMVLGSVCAAGGPKHFSNFWLLLLIFCLAREHL